MTSHPDPSPSTEVLHQLPPKGDLRVEIKKAWEKAGLSSVNFSEKCDVPYERFAAFIQRDFDDFSYGEIVRCCKLLGVEVRARRPRVPRIEPTAEIHDLRDVVFLANSLRGAFYRGHQSSEWELIPGAHRAGPRAEYLPSYDIERFIAQDFRRRAPAILSKVPGPRDFLDWLLYMQHYGAKTRLLDWTESAFVAAYFAVAREDESDGQLWVLNPTALNRRSGFDGPDASTHGPAQQLAEEPFTPTPPPAEGEQAAGQPRACPVAIRPAHLFSRMVAQHSTFTLHPDPMWGLALFDAIEAQDFCWYLVPRGRKWWLMKQLLDAGVSRASLFPELDGLAIGIEEASWQPPPHRFVPPSDFPALAGPSKTNEKDGA